MSYSLDPDQDRLVLFWVQTVTVGKGYISRRKKSQLNAARKELKYRKYDGRELTVYKLILALSGSVLVHTTIIRKYDAYENIVFDIK